MTPPNGTCPSHDTFSQLILNGIQSLKDLVIQRTDDLETNLNRRLDESLRDRALLHEKHNHLSQEVSRMLGKINGGSLDIKPRERSTDTLPGKLKEDWKLYLLIALLAALAGARAEVFLLKLLGQ